MQGGVVDPNDQLMRWPFIGLRDAPRRLHRGICRLGASLMLAPRDWRRLTMMKELRLPSEETGE